MLPPTGPVKLYDEEEIHFLYYIVFCCYITFYRILLMYFIHIDKCSETDRFDGLVRGRTRTLGPGLLGKNGKCETQKCPDVEVDLLACQHGFGVKKWVSPVNGRQARA
jgi:hypothetical protein